MPPVVRIGDIDSGHGCWPPRPNVQGSPDVFVNGIPVHRLGDAWAPHTCPAIPQTHASVLASGDPTVFANNLSLARIGDPVACGSSCASGSPNVFSGSIPAAKFDSFVPDAIREIAAYAGQVAPFDEPVYSYIDPTLSPGVDISDYPEDNPPAVRSPVTDNITPTVEIPEEIPKCGDFIEVDYDINLSQNFQVRDLSIDVVFKHSIKSQAGFTDLEILCNLKALCENTLEPLNSAYPGFRINSGFRTATRGRSQHEKGMAVDIQWPGISNSEYLNRAEFVRDNILFDQFIFEHGNSIWLHLSFDRTKTQRRQVLTMYQKQYASGLTLYYA